MLMHVYLFFAVFTGKNRKQPVTTSNNKLLPEITAVITSNYRKLTEITRNYQKITKRQSAFQNSVIILFQRQ